MHRREFVVGLAVVGAGCLNDDEPETDDEADTDPVSTTESLLERVARDEHIVEMEGAGMSVAGYQGSDDGDLTTAAVLVDGSSEDNPVLLRTGVANTGRNIVEADTEDIPPYGGVGESEDEVLYAVPTDDHDLVDDVPEVGREDGVWRLVDGYDDPAPSTVEVEPDDGYVGEYALVPDDGSPTEGVYDFGGMSLNLWQTDAPGPSEPSRFEGEGMPDVRVLLREGVSEKEMLWYHEADETTAEYTEPSDESVELPASVEFESFNRSSGRLSGGASWALYKLVDDGWVQVAHSRDVSPTDAMLRAGETNVSELRLYPDEPDDEGDRVVAHLGGGRYAYEDTYSTGEGTLGAVFDVDASPVEPEPPADADAEHEEGRTVVTTDAWRDVEDHGYGEHDEGHGDGHDENDDGHGDHHDTEPSDRSEYVVESSSSGEADETVVPEQLYNNTERELRYALPYFEDGVEEVVVRTDAATSENAVVRDDEEGRRFRYRGNVYEARLVQGYERLGDLGHDH